MADADQQARPEAYGQASYTTRQPWMTDGKAVGNATSTTSSFVVDGASVSPFSASSVGEAPIPPEMGAAQPAPSLADPAAMYGTASGLPTNAAAPVARPSGETPVERPIPPPVVNRRRPSSAGRGLFVSLFILFAKAIPLMGVAAGGYYTFSYYFGGVPAIDAVWRKGAKIVGIETAPPPKESKASQLLNQTRDVVAANNKRVDFANALAEPDVNIDALAMADGPATPPAATPAATVMGVMTAAEAQAFDAALAAKQKKPAPDAAPVTYQSYAPTVAEEAPIDVPTAVEPSPAFRAWVENVRIGGVRKGATIRAFLNGVATSPGDTVDFPLGVVFEGLDPSGVAVLFKDKTGAEIGKRY